MHTKVKCYGNKNKQQHKNADANNSSKHYPGLELVDRYTLQFDSIGDKNSFIGRYCFAPFLQ